MAVSHRPGRILCFPFDQLRVDSQTTDAMALNISSRAARTACAASKSVARPIATLIPSRTFATSPSEEPNQQSKPRWSYTPESAKAPFSLHLDSKRPTFHVNADPLLLDRFYIRLFGNGGDKLLSDETKWLAVTHKSFDQGRRGFNDRLAFLGKRIVQLQASLALAQGAPSASAASAQQADEFGRVPFTHPALDGLNNLSGETKKILTERSKLAELANKYELQKVLRWSPRKVCLDVLRFWLLTNAYLHFSLTISVPPASSLFLRIPCTLSSVLSRWRREVSLLLNWPGSGYLNPWESSLSRKGLRVEALISLGAFSGRYIV